MGLFGGKKELKDYKILETVKVKKLGINIDEALKNGSNCYVIFENESFQLIRWLEKHINRESFYLLRRDKSNGCVTYLGRLPDLFCCCDGNIFDLYRYSMKDDHSMTMINTVTGERQKIDYLGEGSVLGIPAKDCWDPVIKVSATDNIIHITFRRKKRNDTNLAANPQNEDFEYCINVVYKNGQFTRMPVTTESITKRGPWPKPGIPLPFGELTEADMDILYSQYGKEKVDEAIRIKEMYG